METREFVFEVGTEEIPARMMEDALGRLREQFCDWLQSYKLDHGETTGFDVYGTPRRLVITGTLPATQADSIDTIKGPPVDVAYEEGEPTQALEGFCAQHDVDTKDVVEESEDGGDYIFVRKQMEGSPCEEVLQQNLNLVFKKLSWPKLMKWGESEDHFIRPVRWLVAFVDEQSLNLNNNIKGHNAGNESRGLRFTDHERVTVENVSDYRETFIESNEIIHLDQDTRRETIRSGADELAREVGGKPVYDEDLLDEVTYLVEAPTPFRGSFDESFLNVPDAVLIETMQDHQWYFPVANGEELMPYFIGVRNGGDQHLETVVEGNEKVLRARLNDADFFYANDLDTSFEDYREELKGVVFQDELGSLYDKTERLANLLGELYEGEFKEDLIQAARHCKNDLVTDMVEEFPKLQGTMGKNYAEESGWEPEVAKVIEEHYKPEGRHDPLPGQENFQDPVDCADFESVLLALVDRLDTLVGFFGIGKRATGSSDPYGLRRDALGILRLLLVPQLNKPRWSMHKLINQVQEKYSENGFVIDNESIDDLKDFLEERLFHYFDNNKIPHEVLQSTIPFFWDRPGQAYKRIEWIREWLNKERFEDLLVAFERINNIADKADDGTPVPDSFSKPAEEQLWNQYKNAKKSTDKALQKDNRETVLEKLAGLRPLVDQYFEEVMVMSENEKKRSNRLRMLKTIRELFWQVADFTPLC